MSTLTIVYLGWICNAVMLLLSLILILILTIIARVNDPIGTLEFHNWVKQANNTIETKEKLKGSLLFIIPFAGFYEWVVFLIKLTFTKEDFLTFYKNYLKNKYNIKD